MVVGRVLVFRFAAAIPELPQYGESNSYPTPGFNADFGDQMGSLRGLQYGAPFVSKLVTFT